MFDTRLSDMRTKDAVRFVLWCIASVFFVTGLGLTYAAIIYQDGQVLGGLAAVNLTVGVLIGFGIMMSYI